MSGGGYAEVVIDDEAAFLRDFRRWMAGGGESTVSVPVSINGSRQEDWVLHAVNVTDRYEVIFSRDVSRDDLSEYTGAVVSKTFQGVHPRSKLIIQRTTNEWSRFAAMFPPEDTGDWQPVTKRPAV